VINLHVLSSYDEYIHFLERTTDSSSAQFTSNMVVVLNCEALTKYLQSPIAPQASYKKLLSIPPYPRAGGIVGRINVIAERRYFQKAWKNLMRSIELDRLENLCVYANFMNSPTASLISYLRSVNDADVRIKFYPTLTHVNTSPPVRPSLKQYLSLLRNRIVYGPYLRLIDIGHKTILSISASAFDEVEFEDQRIQHSIKGMIKHNVLTNGSRKVVFACQPLLKNNRVTVDAYGTFFKELCTILSELDIDVVFKLHPGEIATYYEGLGASIVTDEIPFQHLDLSAVDAVMTFSSGAVVGLSKPIISCTDLLEFRSLEDKREIDKLFDVRLANASQAAASRPTSWEAFIDDIKKAVDLRT